MEMKEIVMKVILHKLQTQIKIMGQTIKEIKTIKTNKTIKNLKHQAKMDLISKSQTEIMSQTKEAIQVKKIVAMMMTMKIQSKKRKRMTKKMIIRIAKIKDRHHLNLLLNKTKETMIRIKMTMKDLEKVTIIKMMMTIKTLWKKQENKETIMKVIIARQIKNKMETKIQLKIAINHHNLLLLLLQNKIKIKTQKINKMMMMMMMKDLLRK